MRIAIVHDWLTGMRGGEKVLSLLCGLMPGADLFTLIHAPGTCDTRIEEMPIKASFLNNLPGVKRYYRYLLPIMPLAIERMDVSGYDFIVSCSHCVAKGIMKSSHAAHLCYCFTPMRYVWSQGKAYRNGMGLSGLALRLMQGHLRAWDLRSSARVDMFLANSSNVAERIRQTYARDAEVVCSPIDTTFFTPASEDREDYYLMVTALAPYKRVDQGIAAFAKLQRPLRIIGDGQLLKKLRRSAPANVKFMGWVSDEVVREHYRRARALIYPGEEDFGLAPLEAMACGTPVIAYAAGGAMETVLDVDREDSFGPTGIHYTPQTVDALVSAVERFEQLEGKFDSQQLITWGQRFGADMFLSKFKSAAAALLAEKGLGEPW
ncbi:MAG: glycosyltransferase [Planctomycetota bacterium]|jgi:glycosyltransferase involved in cell wall biosynthesis